MYKIGITLRSLVILQITREVPQGFILGPLLFNIYMLTLPQIAQYYEISLHTYVDDTQLYITFHHVYTYLLCNALSAFNKSVSKCARIFYR